jgi:hypothetical protein
MTINRGFVELNRASTERIRHLVTHLTDEQMLQRVGEHWTVAIALVHLAFWDRRVLYVLDGTERDGRLFIPEEVDIVVNDLSLPLWAAIPPATAGQIALETAEALDARLERFSPELLEEVHARYPRWIIRALHRNEHLDEIDAALRSQGRHNGS